MNFRRGRIQRSGVIVLASVVMVSLAATAFFFREMVAEIKQLETAKSDNIQWTLSQVEVEFLELKAEIDQATEAEDADLDNVRRQYDIFYSRIGIVSSSATYSILKQNSDSSQALANVRAFLRENSVYIDGPDAELRPVLHDLQNEAEGLSSSIRTIATAGLTHFARQSDNERQKISDTLRHLAVVMAVLVTALLATAVYSNAVDKSNLRRQKEVLQTAERFQTVISTSLDAVIVSDIWGKILEFNEAAEEIFGVRRKDVVGADLAEVIVPAHLREAHNNGLLRMREKGERRFVGKGRTKLEALRANGEVFPVELAVQSAWQGKEEIFIAFLRDISSVVEAEQRLIEARDKALASEKAKANFLAVMSHEIRTPLNGLLGNLTLLGDTPLNHKQRVYYENMNISGRLLMSHVNNVLEITKYEADKLPFKSKPVNLSALIQDVVDAQSGRAEKDSNLLEWGWVGEPLHWVLSDPSRLQQILLNLLGNAIKFTDHGRISIECEVVDRIDGDDIVEFRVSDTGIGIPKEDICRIFEDFVTRDSSFDRTAEGTGLGLGIARRIVQALGGEIGARSTPGEGSTFWFRLPLKASSAKLDTKTLNEARENTKQLDILVVEDNEINRQLVREMLEQDGHRITEAVDGRTGIDLASKKAFDLILMDISMPVIDGRQATREIRSGQGASRATPIVALTANVAPEQVADFRKDGMNDVQTKPLMRNELRSMVARISDGRLAGIHPQEDAAEEPILLDTEQQKQAREAVGEEAFARLLERFCLEGDATVSWLESGTRKTGDMTEIAAQSHKLAGSAAVFGAQSLRTNLLQLECAARDGDRDAAIAAVSSLPKIWNETQTGLSAQINPAADQRRRRPAHE